jgi:uncharacterized protein (TIGR03437 family)
MRSPLPSRDRKGVGAPSNVAPSFQPSRQGIIVLTDPMVSLIGLVRSVPRPHLRICALIFLALLSSTSLHAQLSLFCDPNLGPTVTDTPFSMTCSASGGVGPHTFSATGLPPGLSVTSNNGSLITVSGTPTVSANYDFTIEADDFFFTATEEFTGFLATPLVFSCPTVATQTVGVAFSVNCPVSGGTTPYFANVVSGALPDGVNLQNTDGFVGSLLIAGVPTTVGTYIANIAAIDSAGPTPQTMVAPLLVNVDPPAPPLNVSCGTSTPVIGQTYSVQCTATGGNSPYNYSAAGLPNGVTINSTTGLVNGQPTVLGPFSAIVRIVDSSAPGTRTTSTILSGIVVPPPLIISCPPVGNPVQGRLYNLQCLGSGGAPPLTWSAAGLPNGLAINPTSGLISGTPTVLGVFSATVTLTDSGTPTAQTQSVTLNGNVSQPPLTVNCGAVGKLVQGQVYALECTASGGTKPYKWSAGGLPNGISIDSSSGLISGTPTVLGPFSASITVTDNIGQQQSATVTGTVGPGPLSVTCGVTATLVQNQPFSQGCTASGGTPPYHWSANGLPNGVSIDPGTGLVGGKPAAAGPFTATIAVTDSTTPVAETQSATLSGISLPGLTSPNVPAMLGAPFSFDVTQLFSQILSQAPPGVGSFVFSISGGTLPPGLTLASSILTGIPTEPGNYIFTITLASTSVSPVSANARLAPRDAGETYGPFSDSMTINVAGNSGPPVAVNPGSLTYSFTKGSTKSATQSVVITNSGTSSESYTVNATTGSGGNWVSVSSQAGSVGPTSSSSVTVTVDPSDLGVGTYMGTVSITLQQAQFDVPVTVVVSGGEATLHLSQTGFRFQTTSGSADPFAQNLTILGTGSGSLKYSASASTTSGGPWLSVSPGSGTISSSAPVVAKVRIQSSGLAPGDYYGQIEISSEDASNSPQIASVVLNVASAGVDLGAFVYPTGLVFVAQEGGADPAAQTIAVTNPSKSTLTFSSASFFGQGSDLFTVQPSSGTVNAANPVQITVQPTLAGVPANVYFGEIVLNFAENQTSRHIEVLIVVTPAAASNTTARAVATCTPTKLLPVFTQLGADFATVAAWPTALEVIVVDDCGNFLTTGSVTASFSDGDPSLPLASLNDGHWSATWQPINASAQVVITVDAQELLPKLQGTQAIGGTLQTNPTAPSVAGVGSPAKSVASQPLAPGSFISIYGLHLSAGTNAALSLPLKTELGATQVVLGARPLPLLYSADGQVNAVIPYDVPPNSTQQLIVTNGPALSVPAPITIAASQPAVFANANGSGVVFDVKPGASAQISVDANHPMTAGDAIVIYCAGLGPVNPAVPAGSAAPSSPPAVTTNPVTVTIGGKPAQVFFSGLVGGFAGLYQVNAYVPNGIAPGDAVPLVVSVAGFDSAPVTVAVK